MLKTVKDKQVYAYYHVLWDGKNNQRAAESY